MFFFSKVTFIFLPCVWRTHFLNIQEAHSKFGIMHYLNNFLLIPIEVHSNNVSPHFD